MRSVLISFLFLQFFCACSDGKEEAEAVPASENDVDAARNFIRASLDGRIKDARTFIIQDSTNRQFMDRYEFEYQQNRDREEKRGYRESSIQIHDVRSVNDSVTIVHYSNSFKKIRDSLKVVRVNGQWLVDLNFYFSKTNPAQ